MFENSILCFGGVKSSDILRGLLQLEKVVGLTGFVIIHVFIASRTPAQGERNQMVNAKFTRPVNSMPMSSVKDMYVCISNISPVSDILNLLLDRRQFWECAFCIIFIHLSEIGIKRLKVCKCW